MGVHRFRTTGSWGNYSHGLIFGQFHGFWSTRFVKYHTKITISHISAIYIALKITDKIIFRQTGICLRNGIRLWENDIDFQIQ